MDIYLKYFQKFSNAGDQFNHVLGLRYFGESLKICENVVLTHSNLILLGSILEWSDNNTIVCGAGLIASDTKLKRAPERILCTRGPLTHHFLHQQGIKAPYVFGDPGVLAPDFFTDHQNILFEVGVIPHYIDRDAPWLRLCQKLHVPVINPLTDLNTYFDQLNQCKVILSSSLHGLIFAHAFGKKALWIQLSDKVIGKGFKFYDYYLSAGISPEKVVYKQINENTSPYDLIQFADDVDHTPLLSNIKESLSLAQDFLFIKREY